ncbi:MAG: hypothetical protein H6819_12805 [Phycisphaerales bacterium]|nr:hypothetical protein [Phycisphaerales bacterium]MCB9858762.1 hypothetical protein [Phycisphaerales bacterium]
MIVWFAGSIAIAYWLGEPYLRRHRNDVDPVEARLLAEALNKKDARAATAESPPRLDSEAQRIRSLEERIADAVLRIDAIRSDAVRGAFDVGLRTEVETLRTQVAASNRELEELRIGLSALAPPSEDPIRQFAGPSDKSLGATDLTLAAMPAHSDARSTDTSMSRYWAMGAVGLSLLANLSTVLLLWSRKKSQSALLAVDKNIIAAAWPDNDGDSGRADDTETRESASAGPQSRASGLVTMAPTADEAAEADVADQMIAEMRNASVAGVEDSSGGPDQDVPLLMLVDEEDDYLTARAVKIDVVAENRLGLDFAVRITDRERAGLANRRVGGDDQRSVA